MKSGLVTKPATVTVAGFRYSLGRLPIMLYLRVRGFAPLNLPTYRSYRGKTPGTGMAEDRRRNPQ
jgi:hypothetical protein